MSQPHHTSHEPSPSSFPSSSASADGSHPPGPLPAHPTPTPAPSAYHGHGTDHNDHDHDDHDHDGHDHDNHDHDGHDHDDHDHDDHDHAHPRGGSNALHPDGHGANRGQGASHRRPDHAAPHDHDHSHGHDHDHDDHDNHDHGWFANFFGGHSHDHSDLASDDVLATSERGIRALKLSLVGLGLTAIFQVVIVVISGSVGLLADTIHNFGDALTAIPLWVAFSLNRRAEVPKGYTYRYGRAEDMAGAFIVAAIAFSAGVVFWESWQKFMHPEPLTNIGWVALAAIVGFIGNEAVAWLRISTGRAIGSAALVADGLHARTDGLTSLAVLVGVIGVWLGFPLADPLVGVLIGVVILFILRDSARTIWRRLMDAVEPELVDQVESTATAVPGVMGVSDIRLRWLGHALWCEFSIEVDGTLSTTQSHHIAEEVRHDLYHAIPRLREITIHVDPTPRDAAHELTAHHRPAQP